MEGKLLTPGEKKDEFLSCYARLCLTEDFFENYLILKFSNVY